MTMKNNKPSKYARYITIILVVTSICMLVGIFKIRQEKITRENERAEIRKIIDESEALVDNGSSECVVKAEANYENLLAKVGNRGDLVEGFLHERIGYIKSDLWDLKGCVEEFNKALAVYEKLGSEESNKRKAQTLYHMGIALTGSFREAEERREGIIYLKKAVEEFRELNDLGAQADTLRSIGNTYYWLEETDAGFVYSEEALKLYRQLEYVADEVETLKGVGRELLKRSSSEEKGIEYLEKALSISGKKGYEIGQVAILDTLGRYHVSRDEYEEAQNLYEKALRIAEETNYKQGRRVYGSLSLMYKKMGNTEKSDYYFSLLRKSEDEILRMRPVCKTN